MRRKNDMFVTPCVNPRKRGSRVRVGIVGFGFIGRVHAASWQQLGVELHAFTEPGPPAPTPTGIRFHDDLDSLIGSVDIVDVCVPTFQHAKVAIQAASAGRHVLCEKPIAHTLEDAASMVAAARDCDVQLHIAHVVRWFPQYAAARQAVLDNKVGRVGIIRMGRESSPPQRPPHSWLFDQHLSGGVVGDLMIHDMDFARWVAGDVERVYTKAVGDPLDHALVILTHRNGVLSHLTGSWSQPHPTFHTRFEIAGDHGLISFDSAATHPLQVSIEGGVDQVGSIGLPATAGAVSPFTHELGDILAAVQGGPPPRVDALDATAALRIALAALESARTGRAVELPAEAVA